MAAFFVPDEDDLDFERSSDALRSSPSWLFIGAVNNAKNGCRAFKMDCCVVNNKWETVYKSAGSPSVFRSAFSSWSHKDESSSPGHPEVHCQQLFSRTYLSLSPFSLSLSLSLSLSQTHALSLSLFITRTHTHAYTVRRLAISVAVDVNGKSYWIKEIFFFPFQMSSELIFLSFRSKARLFLIRRKTD